MIPTQVTDQEKVQVWKAYRDHRPVRVPVTFGCNPRVVVLDPHYNTGGWTFEAAAKDPRTHIEVALHFALYMRTVMGPHSDLPTALPEVWEVGLNVYNVYEAAFFGAPVQFQNGQVPCTEPFLTEGNRESIFAVDVDHPLENPYIRQCLGFWQEMEKICRNLKFEGRPVKLTPWALTGTDGPVTVGCNLCGSAFIEDLAGDPDYAGRLMSLITRAAIQRRRAFWLYWGDRIGHGNGIADDSIALISSDMYRALVLPLHRQLYEAADADHGAKLLRGIHLCGDATRHFAAIHRELDVVSFDTGFPVDHGGLRRQLGLEVELLGGPEVSCLLEGSPQQVYERTRSILGSGVKEGGRFTLREGNNLPPRVPQANLAAMYEACLEHGRY